MNAQQYNELVAYGRRLLVNHPDQTLTPGDLVGDAYVKVEAYDLIELKKAMSGAAKQALAHTVPYREYDSTYGLVETIQTCKICMRELPFEDFAKLDKGVRTFIRQTCKQCVSDQQNDTYKRSVDKWAEDPETFKRNFKEVAPPPKYQVCKCCAKRKSIKEFPRIERGMRIYFTHVCKACRLQQVKDRRAQKNK